MRSMVEGALPTRFARRGAPSTTSFAGGPPPRSGEELGSLALIALPITAALIQLAAFWPGILVWDAIRQYGQALAGRYDDWHPPAMNWLWRQLGLFGPGPSTMLVLQVLLYWGGLTAIALWLLRTRHPRRAIAVVALALLPASIVLIATVLKDSLMAGVLLVAVALIAWRPPAQRWPAILAGALLLAAATLRFNAVPACLPLALLLVPERWAGSPKRLALAGAVALIALVAVLPLANRLLHAQRSHVELSLVIYDLGGITRYSGVDQFPPTSDKDPVAINRYCYSPVSWDSYAWWTDDPCPIGWSNVSGPLTAPGTSATGWWLKSLLGHPFAYAAHRFAHFNQDVRFLTHERDLPSLSLASDPNDWGYALPPSRLRDAIEAVAVASLSTPLGWPICWLALAISVLLIAPRSPLATALAWSSLLYGLSYLPLGVASEVRYHLWTMLAAGLAAILGLRSGVQVARWRKVTALALPILVTVIAAGYRLA